jgi:uncharacterized protein YciI
MKTMRFLAPVLLGAVLAACSTQQQPPRLRQFTNEKADWGFKMESFHYAFLVKPSVPHSVPKDSLPVLQQQHLATLKRVYEAGHSLSYGPFGGDSTEMLRGIVIFPGSTPADSITRWLGSDPYIARGVMSLKMLKWWTGDSTVFFADRRGE